MHLEILKIVKELQHNTLVSLEARDISVGCICA